MSAASRLWHRAPLWRLTLFSAIFFGVVTLFYPAPWLLRTIPRLSTVTQKIDHFLGRDTPPAQEDTGDNGLGQSAPAPGGGAPAQSGGGQAAGGQASGANGGGMPATATLQPIDTDLHDILPLAGRQLPLPAGIWHPVLTTQIGGHGEITSNVLIRTDRGVLTGVIIAQASTASMPSDQAEALQASCHDDRNYMNRILNASPASSTCISTTLAVIENGAVSNAPDINLAFDRLRVLSFPMPPLLVSGRWIHLTAAKDGGLNFESINIALSPAEAGSTRLNTPPGDWTKQGVGLSPFSGRFVKSVGDWLTAWAPTLEKGYNNALQPSVDTRPGAKDPAWHEQ